MSSHKKGHKSSKHPKFNALDLNSDHLMDDGAQNAGTVQASKESIKVKDSANIEITTQNTESAVAVQVALNAVLAILLNVAIAGNADQDQSEILNELTKPLQVSKITQSNVQKTVIKNSRGVKVSAQDTETAVHVQALAQVLIALAANLGILGNAS